MLKSRRLSLTTTASAGLVLASLAGTAAGGPGRQRWCGFPERQRWCGFPERTRQHPGVDHSGFVLADHRHRGDQHA